MKKRIKAICLLLVMLLLATTLGACQDGRPAEETPPATENASSPPEKIYGGTINVGLVQDLDDSLDPHKVASAGTREVLFNIFEGLVKPQSDGTLIPAVASKYSVNETGDTFTFTLRDGIKFHSGRLVTVGDIVFSIERCAGFETGTPLIAAFSEVESVTATDEKTVEIKVKAPNIEFLAYLTAAIIPSDYEEQDTKPVGTGPYKFVSKSPQENFIMEAFPDYWGEKPYLDKVTYVIIENAEAMVMALKSGSIDLFSHLTYTQAEEVGDRFDILEGPMNLVQALYLNNSVEPLSNLKVRQALCHALEREMVMLMVADGRGTPVGSSMYPAFKKYFMPELVDYYDYDVQKAKDLLTEAGYPDGFKLTITVPSNMQPHIETAQVLVEQLKAIGVDATIDLVEWATWHSEAYTGRNFEATIVGLEASALTARAMLERFVSTSGKNFINFSDEEFDRVFAEAIAETNDEKQVELYKRLQEILTEQAASVYIQDIHNLVALNKSLGGYEFYPLYVVDISKIYYKENLTA